MRHPNPIPPNQSRRLRSGPVVQSASIMRTTNPASPYALGSSDAEHERLLRQAALLAPRLPLWSAATSLIHETFRRSGANTEMGFALYQIFQQAGLPPPTMSLEMPLGNDPEFVRWVPDVLASLLPQARQFNLPLEPLGDLNTLRERLQAEVAASNSVVTWMAMVGAWSRKPATQT